MFFDFTDFRLQTFRPSDLRPSDLQTLRPSDLRPSDLQTSDLQTVLVNDSHHHAVHGVAEHTSAFQRLDAVDEA